MSHIERGMETRSGAESAALGVEGLQRVRLRLHPAAGRISDDVIRRLEPPLVNTVQNEVRREADLRAQMRARWGVVGGWTENPATDWRRLPSVYRLPPNVHGQYPPAAQPYQWNNAELAPLIVDAILQAPQGEQITFFNLALVSRAFATAVKAAVHKAVVNLNTPTGVVRLWSAHVDKLAQLRPRENDAAQAKKAVGVALRDCVRAATASYWAVVEALAYLVGLEAAQLYIEFLTCTYRIGRFDDVMPVLERSALKDTQVWPDLFRHIKLAALARGIDELRAGEGDRVQLVPTSRTFFGAVAVARDLNGSAKAGMSNAEFDGATSAQFPVRPWPHLAQVTPLSCAINEVPERAQSLWEWEADMALDEYGVPLKRTAVDFARGDSLRAKVNEPPEMASPFVMYGHIPLLTSLDTLLQRTVPANRVAVPDNPRLSLDWMRKSDDRVRNRMPGVDNAFDVATLPEEHRGTLNPEADMDAGELVKMMLLLGGAGGPTERGPGIPYAKPFVSACESAISMVPTAEVSVFAAVWIGAGDNRAARDTVLAHAAELYSSALGMQPCVRTRSGPYRLIVDRRALIEPTPCVPLYSPGKIFRTSVAAFLEIDAAGMTRAWSAVADLHAQRARVQEAVRLVRHAKWRQDADGFVRSWAGVGSFESLSALLPSLELRWKLALRHCDPLTAKCQPADARSMAQQKTLAMYENESERGMRVEVHACEVPTVHVLLVRACTASMLLEEQSNWQMAGVALSSGAAYEWLLRLSLPDACLYNGGGRAELSFDTQPLVFYPAKPGEPVSLLSEGGYGEGTRVHVHYLIAATRVFDHLGDTGTWGVRVDLTRSSERKMPHRRSLKDYEWQFFRRVGRRGTERTCARGAVAEWSPRQVHALRRELTCCADPAYEGDQDASGELDDPATWRQWAYMTRCSYGRSEDDQDWHEAMSRAHEPMEVLKAAMAASVDVGLRALVFKLLGVDPFLLARQLEVHHMEHHRNMSTYEFLSWVEGAPAK